MIGRQRQNAGDNSTNLQVATVNYMGMSYSDIRGLFLDLFKQNFPTLMEEAAATVRERVEEITDQVLEAFIERHPESIGNLRNPDTQMALLQVQREYARTGDRDLGSILIDVLVERSTQNGRTTRQLVLGEALNTLPLLTPTQLAVLSTIWTCNYMYLGSSGLDLEAFHATIRDDLAPCWAGITAATTMDVLHLEYAGCVSTDVGTRDPVQTMAENYRGFFCNGFDASQPQYDALSDRRFIIPCIRNKELLQVSAVNEKQLNDALGATNISKEDGEALRNLLRSGVMTPPQVEQEITAAAPEFEVVVGEYRKPGSMIRHASLTSVGIGIAHANWRRITGSSIDIEVFL
jgi:hypothetical protein